MTADSLVDLRNALSEAIGWRSQNQFLISELHRANETNRRLIRALVEAGEEARGLREEVRMQAAQIRRLDAALKRCARTKRRQGRRTRTNRRMGR